MESDYYNVAYLSTIYWQLGFSLFRRRKGITKVN